MTSCHRLVGLCLLAAFLSCNHLEEGEDLVRLGLGVEQLREDLLKKGEITRTPPFRKDNGAERPPDATLAARVRNALLVDPGVPAMTIEVDVREGWVTLTGRVATLEQLQRALRASLAVGHVTSVTSRIAVEADDGSGPTHGKPAGTEK